MHTLAELKIECEREGMMHAYHRALEWARAGESELWSPYLTEYARQFNFCGFSVGPEDIAYGIGCCQSDYANLGAHQWSATDFDIRKLIVDFGWGNDEYLRGLAARIQAFVLRFPRCLATGISQNGRYDYACYISETYPDSDEELPDEGRALSDAEYCDEFISGIYEELSRWLYKQLLDDYEYAISDEQCEAMAEANNYKFDEWGNVEQ